MTVSRSIPLRSWWVSSWWRWWTRKHSKVRRMARRIVEVWFRWQVRHRLTTKLVTTVKANARSSKESPAQYAQRDGWEWWQSVAKPKVSARSRCCAVFTPPLVPFTHCPRLVVLYPFLVAACLSGRHWSDVYCIVSSGIACADREDTVEGRWHPRGVRTGPPGIWVQVDP